MIIFQDISLAYEGKELITHLNASISTSTKCVIAGTSGSGKSSLLAMIPGFIIPNQGKVILDDVIVNKHSYAHIRSQLAWVPQEFYLPYQDMEQLIKTLFLLKVNEKRKPTCTQIYLELEKIGLNETYFTRKFTELSGGERQRILITVAGLLNKKYILLDEPTSALDTKSIQIVIDYLKELSATMVAVSHDQHFINSFDQIIQL